MHLMWASNNNKKCIYSTNLKSPCALTRDYCTCQHFAFNTSPVRHANIALFSRASNLEMGFSCVCSGGLLTKMQLRISGQMEMQFKPRCVLKAFFPRVLFIYITFGRWLWLSPFYILKSWSDGTNASIKNVQKMVWPFNATLLNAESRTYFRFAQNGCPFEVNAENSEMLLAHI